MAQQKARYSYKTKCVAAHISPKGTNGIPTTLLLDSGAGVSIIDEHSLKQIMKFTAMANASEKLLDASGNKMIVLGKVTIEVSLKGSEQPVVQDFRVVNANAWSTYR